MRIACVNSVRNLCLVLALSATVSGAFAQPAPLPNPDGQNVTMTMFKIITRQNHKYLETQTGETLPISGKQLDKDAQMLAVYRDANANYWFINKHGEPTTIPPDKVQWAINDISEQRAAKENSYPPVGGPNSTTYQQGVPGNQTTIINNEPASNGGSGSSMLGTGLAAAGGAMVGGLIGSSMYDNNHYYGGVPYGAPMYHGANGAYYNSGGNKAYVNNSKTINAANVQHENDAVMKQWNQQGSWANKSSWANKNNWGSTGGEKLGNQSHEGWGGFHRDGGGFRGGGFRR